MKIDVVSPNRLVWMNKSYSCVLGNGGTKLKKVEGDGATPVGRWPLLYVLYRPDRIAKPITGLPVKALKPFDGWCDDPTHASYNKFITKPFGASHEVLWRNDDIYDLIVVLGYNTDPIVRGRGSAIFLHLAKKILRQHEDALL